jgi:hypothetical protein
MSDEPLIKQFVIYQHPLDYPNGYVVREWHLSAGKVLAGEGRTAQSLEDARKLIPADTRRIQGQDPHEPNIVEVWM